MQALCHVFRMCLGKKERELCYFVTIDEIKPKDEALKIENERRKEWQKTENRLADREKTLDNKLEELDRRAEKLRAHEDEVDNLKNEIRDIRSRQQEKLEKIAGLKKKDAADKLMQMTERDIKQDLVGLVSKLQHDAMDDAEEQIGRAHV